MTTSPPSSVAIALFFLQDANKMMEIVKIIIG
jgi:hypothetical protein